MDVFGRIDNCNILLHGLPKTSISNLQHLHHQTCVLMRTRRQDITPILKPLHRFPVRIKFDFKVLLLGYYHINGLGSFNIWPVFTRPIIFICCVYLFLSTFGNLSVDFLLPCLCLAKSGLPMGVLPWDLSGMGRRSAALCHYGHGVGSSIYPGRGGPCGGAPWGWSWWDLRMWMAS